MGVLRTQTLKVSVFLTPKGSEFFRSEVSLFNRVGVRTEMDWYPIKEKNLLMSHATKP